MKNQRSSITKTLLEKTLIDLLKKKSIIDISVREICEKSGVSRSSFYHNFESQFDLLNYMEEKLIKDIDALIAFPGTDYKILENNLIKVLQYMKENKEFCTLLLENSIDKKFPEKLFMCPCIKETFQQSFLNKVDETIRPFIASFVTAGCFALVKKWVSDDCKISEDIIAKTLLSFTYKF